MATHFDPTASMTVIADDPDATETVQINFLVPLAVAMTGGATLLTSINLPSFWDYIIGMAIVWPDANIVS